MKVRKLMFIIFIALIGMIFSFSRLNSELNSELCDADGNKLKTVDSSPGDLEKKRTLDGHNFYVKTDRSSGGVVAVEFKIHTNRVFHGNYKKSIYNGRDWKDNIVRVNASYLSSGIVFVQKDDEEYHIFYFGLSDGWVNAGTVSSDNPQVEVLVNSINGINCYFTYEFEEEWFGLRSSIRQGEVVQFTDADKGAVRIDVGRLEIAEKTPYLIDVVSTFDKEKKISSVWQISLRKGTINYMGELSTNNTICPVQVIGNH